MKRKTLIIIGVVVVVLLIAIVALPMLIDVNQFKPTLQTDMGTALGRKVEIGNISLAILSGGVSVSDVSISDDPAFSKAPFLKAKELTVGVELMPLIFSKKLEVRSFTVVEPDVTLLRNSAGVWNYSSLGGGGSKSTTKPVSDAPQLATLGAFGDAPGGTEFTVQKLALSNGKITIGSVGSKSKPLVYQDVDLEASDLSYTSQFPFTLTAKDPGKGAVKVDGKAGPLNRTDTSATPVDAKINVEHLDLATFGALDSSSGLAGSLDFDGTVKSDGRQMSSKGTVKANKLKMSKSGAPSSVPVNVDYDTTLDMKTQAGTLKQGDIHIGKALARLTGSYNMAGETTSVQMKLNGQGMPIQDLEGALPAVGVTLPSGASLQGGTLDANLAISGPTDRLVITGPVNASNTKLAGFNMGSKLGALSAFTGMGGGGGGSDTVIQTFSTNLRMSPEGTHAQDLNLVVPSIGTITGDGNVSASGQLNCKMLAKLANAGAVGAATQMASKYAGLGGLAGGGGSQNNGIPFMIQGTTSNPVFVPDVAGMAGGMLKGGSIPGAAGAAGTPAAAATGILGGLLGKQKKPQ